MTYHQKTWNLFGMTPRQSPVAHTMLDVLERQHGVTFPAAVREWYATVWTHDLYTLHQPEPEYIPNTPLQSPSRILSEQQMGTRTVAAYSMMLSPYWAGEYTWAVPLDPDFPDPRVYVARGVNRQWMDAGARFSEMIFATLWDTVADEDRYENGGRVDAAPALLLPALTACYERLPTTITQDRVTHRFQGDDLRVVLIYDPLQGTTSVILYTNRLAALRKARLLLHPFEDIRWSDLPGLVLDDEMG